MVRCGRALDAKEPFMQREIVRPEMLDDGASTPAMRPPRSTLIAEGHYGSLHTGCPVDKPSDLAQRRRTTFGTSACIKRPPSVESV